MGSQQGDTIVTSKSPNSSTNYLYDQSPTIENNLNHTKSSSSRLQSPVTTIEYLKRPHSPTPAVNFPRYPQIRISEPGSSCNQFHVSSMDDLVLSSKAHMKPKIANKVKLKYHNQALISYLTGQGLNMNPLKLPSRQLNSGVQNMNLNSSNTQLESFAVNSTPTSSTNIETYITGNGQILFLPFDPEKKKSRSRRHIHDEYNDDEDDPHDHDHDNEDENENEEEEDTEISGSFREDSALDSNGSVQQSSGLPDLSAIYGESGLNGNAPENVTYHTFGIIIKIKKTSNLNKIVRVNYHAHASVKYDAPEYLRHHSFDERYRVSKMLDWNLDLSNPDCYIPFNKPEHEINASIDDDTNTTDDSHDSDSSGFCAKGLADMVFADIPTQKIKIYTPLPPKDYILETPALKTNSLVERNLFTDFTNDPIQSKTFDPGYYVYLLPVVYPVKTPETIIAPNTQVSHDISIQIQKGSVPFPTLQAPQTAFLSTSPTHHHRYDDSASDIHIGSPLDQPIHSSKSSFLKKIGIRRSSVSSAKSENSSKFHPASPKSILDIPVLLSGSRVNSNAQSFMHSIPKKLSSLQPAVQNYSYKLPTVRLPPSDATSTVNKSIYVNKIWNNALNYELLLPRKYTQLSPPTSMNIGPNNRFLKDNTFFLEMKLVPLVKNLQLKRIKINIVEKITYFDKASHSKSSKKLKGRTVDRVVTMMEIKTKDKPQNYQSSLNAPLKTQIIKGCENDNLLTFCYDASKRPSRLTKENDAIRSRSNSNGNKLKQASASLFHSAKRMSRALDSSLSDHSSLPKENITITNPVKLQCPLKFSANDDHNFISGVYDNLCKSSSYLTALQDESTLEKYSDSLSIFSVNSNNENDDIDESRSPVARSRAFSFSSTNASTNANWDSIESEEKSRIHTFIPDTSFSHFKVRHRLQISFRISKREEKTRGQEGEPKMHHYEVIVDTPIIFVSPFCVDDTLELPSYEDAVKTSIFESDIDTPGFSISKTDSTMLSDESDSCLSSNDQHATLTPCSPLMKDSCAFPYNNIFSADLSSNEQVTNVLGSSPISDHGDSHLHRRQKSDLSVAGSVPINATSLLSAAFTRSKDRSNSLHSALATDLSSLSLTSSSSHLNTIDSVMCERSAPPQYSTIGTTSKLSSLMKQSRLDLPPSYDTSLSEDVKNVGGNKPKISLLHQIESKVSLRSENMGLLQNHGDDRSSIIDVGSQASEGSMNLDSLNDIDNIINMSSNNVASLNMTPTRND